MIATANKIGKRTYALSRPPILRAWAGVGGKQEGQGPLGGQFDELCEDSFFGEETWEKAESAMQKRSLTLALAKSGLTAEDLDMVLAGDLMNQCIGSGFSMRAFPIPFCGLYGACSTMGESLALGAALLDGSFGRHIAAMTSSHFCTAERQYRTPVPYGGQRTPTAQWTATAAGCAILSAEGKGPALTHLTFGQVEDRGIKDVSNMGAAMAPAAYSTLSAFFRDTGASLADFDLIATGDLGKLGSAILRDLFAADGVKLGNNYTDCGLLLYDAEGQDMHCGGSGCGCSAAVLCTYLLPQMAAGHIKRLLFAPTGALLSPTSSAQGESIPGICHAVVLEQGG